MSTINVTLTGAAGRIAYSLIPLICNGDVFGKNVRVHLRLLDIEQAAIKLEGLKLEIEDSCFQQLDSVTATTDPNVAFQRAQVAILLGGFPRLPGMERKDLIEKNAEGMKDQARAMNDFADPNVKVVVIANPCNTNCLVAMKCAPNINPKNFTCLTRLDQERLRFLLREEYINESNSHVSFDHVRNIAIFGNHSATQVPVMTDCYIIDDMNSNPFGKRLRSEAQSRIISTVQKRGAEVIRLQGAGSAFSAARAIVKHIQDWLGVGDFSEEVFSMGVLSNGNPYGIPDDLVFSFPCRRRSIECGANALFTSDFEIIGDMTIDQESRDRIKLTVDELLQERSDALRITQQSSKL